MRGLWKQVDRGGVPPFEPRVRQEAGVSAERRGVAAHEDDTVGLGRGDGTDDIGSEAGPGRVGDDDVGG